MVSSEGTNERAVITQARKHGQEVDAVENFKRRFEYGEPENVNTGIAFLIVCDMLLTGFDASIEQVMYIEKFDEDPALYQKLSEKLESLIQQYKDNWDQLYQELFALRTEVEAGRKDEKDPKSGPFFDLIGQLAFGKAGVPTEHAPTVTALVTQIIEKLKRTIGIINFWGNAPEVSKLKGELSDLLLFSNIDEIVAKSDKIVAEVTALAKVRHKDILS